MIRRRLHWLLIWLQAWSLFLALFLGGGPTLCEWLPNVGVCRCGDPDVIREEGEFPEDCWRDQGAYRVEVAALILYLTFAGLTYAGRDPCNLSDGSWSLIVGRIIQHTLTIPALVCLFFFLPNSLFWGYSYVAVAGAGLSQALQAVLFIDFAYDFNSRFVRLAQDCRRDHIDGRREKAIKGILVGICVLIVATVMAGLVLISRERPGLIWFWVSVAAFMLALLFISILKRCKHGALLTSSLLLAYVGWQCWEVSANLPDDHVERPYPSVGVVLLFGMLVYYGVSYGFGNRISGENEAHRVETAAANSEIGIDTTAFASSPGVELNVDFATRCLVHAAASACLCSKVAMYRGLYRGTISMLVVITTVFLYGWTLIAPTVLPSRSFPE